MSTRRWLPVLLAAATLAAACSSSGDDGEVAASSTSTTVAITSTTTTAADDTPDLTVITESTYGAIRIGMTFDEAAEAGLLASPVELGCELDSGSQIADLEAPLDGYVYGHGGRIENIRTRRRFLTSPGDIELGDPVSKVQSGFADTGYTVEVDKDSVEQFGAWFVTVLDGDHEPVFTFDVDPDTEQVTSLGVPYAPGCE
jgi:hypothetical protein